MSSPESASEPPRTTPAPAHALAEMMRAALACHRAGNLDEAAQRYTQIVEAQPDHFEALHGLALVAIRQGHLERAERLLRRALAANTNSVEAWANLAVVQKALDRFEEALASVDHALAIEPRHLNALYNRGIVLLALGRGEDALGSYNRALALKPDFVEAFNNRGAVLATLHRHEEALADYERAVALQPRFAEALHNRGLALSYTGRHALAAADFERALAMDRELPFVEGMLLHARMHCCDWRDFDAASSRLVEHVRAGKAASDPLTLLALSDRAMDQRICAETWVRYKCAPAREPLWHRERYGHDRVRIAYLSADFREHPTSHLVADLFARHDRERFEIIALSFGADTHDTMRTQLQRDVERFIDVANATDQAIAELMRSLEIDIAVDLMGFTADARPGVLARRPAPVQASYLGFPATMGAPYIDYIVADTYVIPQPLQAHYAEHVAYLPETFQPVSAKRAPDKPAPTRAQAGLPEQGFVFASFNNAFKLTPSIFRIWMRLLDQVDGSVLWLVADGAEARANLRHYAEHAGIDPARLVFAPRIAYDEHLARLPLADLFLDTFPFNGGATASDALWAGLPVLTCSGEAFASRMAGSLVRVAACPALATESLEAYEATALRLATEPALLREMRQRLVAHETSVFLDADRFRRHLEAAYLTMWQRHQRGEAAGSFS